MIFGWTRKRRNEATVSRLYHRVGEAARAPWLYLEAGVPDTVEGRLEALMLHCFLLIRRLKSLPEPGPDVAQDLVDQLFRHIDHGLRELGVGDTSIARRMKGVASHFFGRVQAYDPPLAEGDADALAAALARNIPGVRAERLAAFVIAIEKRLAGLDLETLLTSADPLERPPEGSPA